MKAFKRRFIWFLIGMLFATVAYAVVNRTFLKTEPTIPADEAIKLAHELQLEVAKERSALKSEIVLLEAVYLESDNRWKHEIRLREIAEARFDRRPVKIVQGDILPPEIEIREVLVDGPSISCEPYNATIGGSCRTEKFELGEKHGIKILWSASAKWFVDGQSYFIADERTDPEEITFEILKPEIPKVPRFRKTPWIGGLWTSDGYALTASYVIQGRKWGFQPIALANWSRGDDVCITQGDGFCFNATEKSEVNFGIGASVTWRKKAWPPL